MWTTFPDVFPFFKKGRALSHDGSETSALLSSGRNASSRKSTCTPPTLRVSLDKTAYRPGDVVVATIDIGNNELASSTSGGAVEFGRTMAEAVLMEDLLVDVKGIERVDPLWLVTPRVTLSSKQRKGRRIILESLSTSIVSNVEIGLGETKTYCVRTLLPKVLPPSYKGTAVRYVYYWTVSIRWTYSVVENGHGAATHLSMAPVEVQTPFNVWILPNSSGLTADELHSKDHYGFSGIVPPSSIKLEIQWREKDNSMYWAQAADVSDLQLDDEKSSRRSESSNSSPVKGGTLEQSFERALLLPSSSGITSAELLKGNLASTSLRKALSHSALPEAFLAEKEAAVDDILSRSFDKRIRSWDGATEASTSFQALSRSVNGQLISYDSGNDGGCVGAKEEERGISPPSSPSVKYMRGKTYNIRLHDQILVRFGPRNPESVYYYGDTVLGTLSFLQEGPRRCLEVSAVLETREILNPSYIHPSRKNSSVISKVHSEYTEAVCDVLNSHFVFSIPMDGPPSFSTPLISVQWVLRFEFVASPPNVDWDKYAHPLLMEERETGEWSLPIVVHPPLPPRARKERPVSPPKSEGSAEPNRPSFSSSIGGSPVTGGGGASSVSSA